MEAASIMEHVFFLVIILKAFWGEEKDEEDL